MPEYSTGPSAWSYAALLAAAWRGALAALCSNWGNDTCSNSVDGACSCAWDAGNMTCIRSDDCSNDTLGTTGDEDGSTTEDPSVTSIDHAARLACSCAWLAGAVWASALAVHER